VHDPEEEKPMGIASEIQKLEQLRLIGTLTDEEFAKAKSNLLATPSRAAVNEAGPYLEEQFAELHAQNELARLDRDWDIERQRYQIMGRYGLMYTPTVGTALATAVIGAAFGIFWTALGFTMTNVWSAFGLLNEGPFLVINFIVPLLGILFTIGAIWRGVYYWLLAQNHATAYRVYQQRRDKLLSPNMRSVKP
jgi:hypothetical protein